MSPMSCAPEQLFADPADVIDWLRTLDPNGGAGVSGESKDCTLSRYARAKLGADYQVRVGTTCYAISKPVALGKSLWDDASFSMWGTHEVYPTPLWAAHFIARHDQTAPLHGVVSVEQAIALLKQVVADLRHEALSAEQARFAMGYTQIPLWATLAATTDWSWSASPMTEKVLV